VDRLALGFRVTAAPSLLTASLRDLLHDRVANTGAGNDNPNDRLML